MKWFITAYVHRSDKNRDLERVLSVDQITYCISRKYKITTFDCKNVFIFHILYICA